MNSFLERLGIELPILQAPMAGVSTPALAAAVSNAGALGAIGVGATDAAGARTMIADLRAATVRPFNVNVFVHHDPRPDPERERAWAKALAPTFRAYGAEPPASLRTIYLPTTPARHCIPPPRRAGSMGMVHSGRGRERCSPVHCRQRSWWRCSHARFTRPTHDGPQPTRAAGKGAFVSDTDSLPGGRTRRGTVILQSGTVGAHFAPPRTH